MSNLLDEKFPVQKNYDKQLLWLLSFLLVLAISAVVYLMTIHFNEIPVAQLTKEKIIYKPVYIDHYIQGTDDSDNTQETSYAEANLASSNSDTKTSVTLYPEINTSSYLTFVDYIKNQQFSSYLASQGVDYITPLQELGPQSLQILEKATASGNELSDEQKTDSQPVIDPYTTKRKVKFNLGASAFVANGFDYSGYGLSSGVAFPIGKKIGINTGLGVNFVSRDYIILPFFQKDNQDQLLKSNEQANLESEETYYSGLRSFNQVYLPVNIQYNLNNKLSFNSGVNFRFTYSEQIDNVLAVQASRKLPKNENAKQVFFNNANIGISAGFGYIINNNLSINLDSEWGLNSLINNDRIKDPSNTKYDLNLINFRTNYTF